MRKLFYVPLEPYKERYTVQLSAPKTGWLERNWIKHGVNYTRIDGKTISDDERIKAGSVLDAAGRGYWSCSQIAELLLLLQNGKITSDDAIYFDDFWTPGIEALPYAFHLLGIKPKLYSMLHAQSIDQFDFTYPMRHWIRHFEKGIASIMDGIFVTSTCLKDLCLYHGVGTNENVFICGLPYNSEEVFERVPPARVNWNQVIYSSRWDEEKDPAFFMALMLECVRRKMNVKFVVTTSAKKLRSNNPFLLDNLHRMIKNFPDKIELREGLTKEEYYWSLAQSHVQINTANQDFVSWTLLEATTCGCRPLYPYFLSFPEALQYRDELMYVKGDIYDAATKLQIALDSPLDEDYSWVYKPFDKSWLRMLQIMENRDYGIKNLY